MKEKDGTCLRTSADERGRVKNVSIYIFKTYHKIF